MFFRGRQREASIWRRFRTSPDGFTFTQEGDLWVAHVVANAERVVDLFYILSENLPPAVDVCVDDLRSGAVDNRRHIITDVAPEAGGPGMSYELLE